MKSLLSLMVVTTLMVTTTNAQPPLPMPEGTIISEGPIMSHGTIVSHGPAVPLFTNVEVEDRHNIAPCAVPKIIMVPDPCAPKHGCCEPQCVAIQICVPPTDPCACGCYGEPRISRKYGGRKIKYDYGKYEVEVSVRKGYIKVDYDD